MLRTIDVLCCLALAALAPACLEESLLGPGGLEGSEEGVDERDEPFAAGKADGACVEPGSPAAEGVLALVNDPEVSVELLDDPVSEGGVGLDRRAAQGIVAARPIEDLAALDAVPYVGIKSCQALAERACNVDRRCLAPVRLMSWNTEHFPLTPEAPKGVVEIIDLLQPAIVGIQEIEDTAAFDAMLTQLPGYTGILAEPGPYTRVGVLVDDAQIEVLGVEHLFVEDWWPFPRPVVAVRANLEQVADPDEPTRVTFMVVHLKAMSDATSQARRAEAIDMLRALVEARRAAGEGEIVIVGDWNDQLTDVGASNVFGPLLDPSAGTRFLTMDEAESGDATLIPWGSLIDHVMATEEVLEAMPHESTEVLHLDQTWSPSYEQVVSDHRPVLTVLGLPQAW